MLVFILSYNTSSSFFVIFITLAMMVANMQPYKAQFSVYNFVDSILPLLLALRCGTIDGFVGVNIKGMIAQRWLNVLVIK